MLDLFWEEYEKNTSPCDVKNFRKHGETFLRLQKHGSIVKLRKIISKNPIQANRTLRFVAKLADKYQIVIEGIVYPTLVGPSFTKDNTFYAGMDSEKLVKWYMHYGAEIIGTKEDGTLILRREPRHETSN